jgi:hypothetical protein
MPVPAPQGRHGVLQAACLCSTGVISTLSTQMTACACNPCLAGACQRGVRELMRPAGGGACTPVC